VQRDEIIRRFRLVTLAYLVIGATLVIGLAIDYQQAQDLQHNTHALLVRDCDLVVSTANVFTDFIRKEIQLRELRSGEAKVSTAVRLFDEAEIREWTHNTLPALKQVYAVKCAALTQ